MEFKDKLNDLKIEELFESLHLPKLKFDLDSVPIENELFVDYQANVEQNLPLLFDFVQQQKQFIYENEKLHSSLILLLCELTADTIFRIRNERLLLNVGRLLDAEKDLSASIEAPILEYYSDKLKQNVWKRHMGAVHGFVHFLKHFYCKNNKRNKKFEGRWLNFSLAVALNIRDCHETAYKQLGIQIFLIILKQGRADELRAINLHSVIYESVLKDVHTTETVAIVENIWDCLLLCLDIFNEIDSISWSKVDDLMEILIRYIPLTNSATMSVCLLGYLIKLCLFFTLNRSEINHLLEATFNDTTHLEDCRNICISNTSYTIYRWAKSILETIIFECHKLMADEKACLDLLIAMHKCYLVAILPIPVSTAEPHLVGFFDKFTSVLMEAIVVHKKRTNIVKATRNLIDTFMWHLERSNIAATYTQLTQYQKAFKELCQNKVFAEEMV